MEVLIINRWGKSVRVSSPIGSFNGVWCSSDPVISKRYIVELDSDSVLTLDAIKLSSSASFHIECIKDVVYFTGLVEGIENNVMYLRLCGSIVMLELLPHSDFEVFIGRYITVRINDIKLYDTGIKI